MMSHTRIADLCCEIQSEASTLDAQSQHVVADAVSLIEWMFYPDHSDPHFIRTVGILMALMTIEVTRIVEPRLAENQGTGTDDIARPSRPPREMDP